MKKLKAVFKFLLVFPLLLLIQPALGDESNSDLTNHEAILSTLGIEATVIELMKEIQAKNNQIADIDSHGQARGPYRYSS